MFKSVTTITKILFGVTVALAGATTVSALRTARLPSAAVIAVSANALRLKLSAKRPKIKPQFLSTLL